MPCDHLNVMVKPFSFVFPYKVNTGGIINNPTSRIKTTKRFIRHTNTQPSSRSDVRSADTALLNMCIYLVNQYHVFLHLLTLPSPCARTAFSFLERTACEQLKAPIRRRLGEQLRGKTHLSGPRPGLDPSVQSKGKEETDTNL